MSEAMGGAITVHKLDAEGKEVWQYDGIVVRRSAVSVTLEAYFDREDVVFSGLHLRTGDRFVETFYNDRWYNVFRIYDVVDGQLKGWYCNITRPARIQDKHVYADDLALDLVVTRDREIQVLDEDEFAALHLPPEEHQLAMNALEKLKTLAAARSEPFSVDNE